MQKRIWFILSIIIIFLFCSKFTAVKNYYQKEQNSKCAVDPAYAQCLGPKNHFDDDLAETTTLYTPTSSIDPLKNYCTRLYILDLSSQFMSKQQFSDLQYFLTESLQICMNKNIGHLIRFGVYDQVQSDDLNQNYGFYECTNRTDCINLVNGFKYENMTVDFGNETGIYANDTTFILHYADHMSELLKSFCKCRFNSAVLLTNRIVNITSESTLDFTDIISYSCTEFTTILLGRNDADYNDTLNLLKETYGVIRDNMADKSTVFNVPDYSCLGYLTTCISPCQTSSSLSCDGIQLDNCLANTTTTTTTITTTATTATTTTAPSTTSTATTTATAPSTASSTTTATATPPEVYILLIFIQIYFYYSQRFW